MEDIKDYLDKSSTECWERLKKNPHSLIDKIESDEITTEAIGNVIAEDMKRLNNSLESLLEKVDRCLEMQEKNIQTVDYIDKLITQ